MLMIEVIKIICATLLTLLRVVRYSRFPSKLETSPSGEKVSFVLGNGPSLNTDLEKCKNMQFLGDVWCVNQFAETALYEQMQPKNYVFADSSYWRADETDSLIQMRKQLFSKILNKTTWQLTIYAPFRAKNHFEMVFGHALNITLHFYNSTTVLGSKRVVKVLYDYGLGMPWVQNVLVAALFLSLRRGYKTIYLLGADHSWHETLELDDENRVCFRDHHFYEGNAKLIPFTMGGDQETTFTMPQLFFALSKMFEGYWKIKEYAKTLGAEVFNASSITYVDAFKRVKLADIFDFTVTDNNVKNLDKNE
jgi:hypothetical protein